MTDNLFLSLPITQHFQHRDDLAKFFQLKKRVNVLSVVGDDGR